MKVNLNLKQKMQGFGMYANKGSAERIVNNGVQKTTNETQQRVQDVQDAYYNYKNKQLSLMVDTLMNGHITNRRKCPTLSEEINNDPRIDDEIKYKAALYDAIENGQVVVQRGYTGHL